MPKQLSVLSESSSILLEVHAPFWDINHFRKFKQQSDGSILLQTAKRR